MYNLSNGAGAFCYHFVEYFRLEEFRGSKFIKFGPVKKWHKKSVCRSLVLWLVVVDHVSTTIIITNHFAKSYFLYECLLLQCQYTLSRILKHQMVF